MTRDYKDIINLHKQLRPQECRTILYQISSVDIPLSINYEDCGPLLESVVKELKRKSDRDITFKLKTQFTPDMILSLLIHMDANGLSRDDFLD